MIDIEKIADEFMTTQFEQRNSVRKAFIEGFNKSTNVISEKILLQESHGWNGLPYEQGYQKAIEDINLLILSLKVND